MKFSILNYVKCIAKAFWGWCRFGIFVPHIFGEEKVLPAIVIASEKDFRLADSYAHNENEEVYPHAAYITCSCVVCGKKAHAWYPDFNKYMTDRIPTI